MDEVTGSRLARPERYISDRATNLDISVKQRKNLCIWLTHSVVHESRINIVGDVFAPDRSVGSSATRFRACACQDGREERTSIRIPTGRIGVLVNQGDTGHETENKTKMFRTGIRTPKETMVLYVVSVRSPSFTSVAFSLAEPQLGPMARCIPSLGASRVTTRADDAQTSEARIQHGKSMVRDGERKEAWTRHGASYMAEAFGRVGDDEFDKRTRCAAGDCSRGHNHRRSTKSGRAESEEDVG
jgi:hypothetical protein